jgi:hypothetical protein
MYPKLKLVVEYGPKGSLKFFPVELLEIYEEEDKLVIDESRNGWSLDSADKQWYSPW